MFKTNINIYFIYPSNRKTIKAWFPYDRNDRSTTIAAIAAILASIWNHTLCDLCNRCAAIVAIIWKPGFNRFAVTRINEVNVYVCFKHRPEGWVRTSRKWVRIVWVRKIHGYETTGYLLQMCFTGFFCLSLLIRKCYHFKWQSNPLKSIINRLKRVTNGELRFQFSLFVAKSEFETSALVWCFTKKMSVW